MCALYLAGTWYRRAQGDSTVNVVKILSGRKTAVVALLGTTALTPLVAVNRVERTIPSSTAIPYLSASAVLFVGAVAASISQFSRTNTRQTPLKTASGKSTVIVLTLLLLALTSSAQTPILLVQAFVFALPAAALSLQGEPTTEQPISRNSSAATLYAPAHDAGTGEDAEAAKSPEGTGESLFPRLQAGRHERARLAAAAVLVLLPVLVWLGRNVWVFMGAPGEETMSVRGYGWKREADYDMYVPRYNISRFALSRVFRAAWSRTTTRTGKS